MTKLLKRFFEEGEDINYYFEVYDDFDDIVKDFSHNNDFKTFAKYFKNEDFVTEFRNYFNEKLKIKKIVSEKLEHLFDEFYNQIDNLRKEYDVSIELDFEDEYNIYFWNEDNE